MPIPLGIFAVAGAGGAGATYEHIANAFGTGSSDTITLSDIPSTYKHLQVRYVIKGVYNGSSTNGAVRFNGDSSTTYRSHYLRGNSVAVASADGGGGTTAHMTFQDSIIGSQTDYNNMFATGIMDILDYTSTSKNKTLRTLAGIVGGSGLVNRTYVYSGLYISTNAITSITFQPQTFSSGQQFTSTSRISLYGIKG
jgi:hypothetical protein